MPEPTGNEKATRVATIIALVAVVVIAPLVGVYAVSPFLFSWGLEPYPLAVSISGMLTEAVAIAALFLLVFKDRR